MHSILPAAIVSVHGRPDASGTSSKQDNLINRCGKLALPYQQLKNQMDHIDALINAGSKELAKSLLIGEALNEYLSVHGLPEDPYDLNPQLNIVRATESIVPMVMARGIPCTHEDVMLYWLTVLVYGGPEAEHLVAKKQ